MLRAAVLASFAVVLSACPGPPEDICGLPTSLPTVDEGFGEATRSDGEEFKEEGTWAPAPASSVTIGTLDMIIAADEEGSVVDDLIADGAFPICVKLGERSETSGSANLVEGGFVTNANNTGNLAILGKDGDVLTGRFKVDLVDNAGTQLSFDDGVFALPQRDLNN